MDHPAPPRDRHQATDPIPPRDRHQATDDPTSAAVAWLLASTEPAVRYLTRRDVLGEPAPGDGGRILDGPKVRALLEGQQPDGGFGGHPYRKWTGVHWRLVSLVELAAPAGDPRLLAAAGRVLDWLAGGRHRSSVRVVDGLARRCASQEGNALAACCRVGLADDPRAGLLARSLVDWQWPDGGWNCDLRASGRRSSFHESLPPAWGLHEYATATGAGWAAEAAGQAAELLLEHRLFRSLGSGETIDRRWLALHYPPYWHYDILQALLILARLGKLPDARAGDALDVLVRRRRKDGRWQPGGSWWSLPGQRSGPVEVVDWGRSGPSEMLTLNALRVLRAAAPDAVAGPGGS
jgi:hypothetical protein